MSSQLFFTNLPHDCSEGELKEWVESMGVPIDSVRIIRDLVSGVSPAFAYAEPKDLIAVDQKVLLLDGKKMRTRIVIVKHARIRGASLRKSS
jgi:hypothetical protein